MSWSLEVIGSKENAQKKVDAQQHMPDVVKNAIRNALAAVPEGESYLDHIERVVHVKTNGHIDANHGGVVSIEIKTVEKV